MPTPKELELEKQHQDDLLIIGRQASTIARLRGYISMLYCKRHDKPTEAGAEDVVPHG